MQKKSSRQNAPFKMKLTNLSLSTNEYLIPEILITGKAFLYTITSSKLIFFPGLLTILIQGNKIKTNT